MSDNISIIISVYNEERRIEKTYLELKSLEKYFEDKNIEILFVDDGSTDSTKKLLKILSLRNLKKIFSH